MCLSSELRMYCVQIFSSVMFRFMVCLIRGGYDTYARIRLLARFARMPRASVHPSSEHLDIHVTHFLLYVF